MGYYTRFTLNLSAPDGFNIDDLVEVMKLPQYNIIDWVFDENLETYDEAKWYNHEDDMKEISKLFPDVLFELHGEGEENDDMWIQYFKDGKTQLCMAQIVFEPYDESKLT